MDKFLETHTSTKLTQKEKIETDIQQVSRLY